MTTGNDNNEFQRLITTICLMIMITALIWVLTLRVAGII